MTTAEKQLKAAIRKCLKAAEQRHNYTIRPDERDFIIKAHFERVARGMDKWVAGARKHKDERWRDVNFMRNALEELDDLPNYIDGLRLLILNNKTKV